MRIVGVEYLESRDCLLAIRLRVDELSEGIDPAPWYVASPAAQPGDNETPNVRQMAIYQRANQTFFRAMLLGSLGGWFVDGNERWRIPGWAWTDQGGDWRSLIFGNDFLHPLAPADVRRWACHEVLVEQAEFERWLQSDELADQSGFPDLPPAYDEADRPRYVEQLEPPDRPNVSLAHAISWLAFGISLDAQTLMSALSVGVLGSDRWDAHQRIEAATDRLVTAGTGGLSFVGKFVTTRGEDAVLTEPIEPARFEDFRQFDLVADGLRYGTGFREDHTAPGMLSLARAFPGAGQRFVDVKVERDGLMTLGSSDVEIRSQIGIQNGQAVAVSGAGWDSIVPGPITIPSGYIKLADAVSEMTDAFAGADGEYQALGPQGSVDGHENKRWHRELSHGQDAERELLQSLQGRAPRLRAYTRGGPYHEPEQIDAALFSSTDWDQHKSFFLSMICPYPSNRYAQLEGWPIFVREAEWKTWKAANNGAPAAAPQVKRRGRTPGSGTYAAPDAPLLVEMGQMLDTGAAISPEGAAKIVAHKAAGPATIESKTSRLARAYRAQPAGD